MDDIISRIDALLANTPQSEIEEFEVTRCLRDCRDEIIAARACAEMMLQGTGQKICESMAMRVLYRQWIPVEERLPEENTDVLVSVDENSDDCGMHVCDYYDGKFLRADAGYIWGVTHWMPLPEPPEVK